MKSENNKSKKGINFFSSYNDPNKVYASNLLLKDKYLYNLAKKDIKRNYAYEIKTSFKKKDTINTESHKKLKKTNQQFVELFKKLFEGKEEISKNEEKKQKINNNKFNKLSLLGKDKDNLFKGGVLLANNLENITRSFLLYKSDISNDQKYLEKLKNQLILEIMNRKNAKYDSSVRRNLSLINRKLLRIKDIKELSSSFSEEENASLNFHANEDNSSKRMNKGNKCNNIINHSIENTFSQLKKPNIENEKINKTINSFRHSVSITKSSKNFFLKNSKDEELSRISFSLKNRTKTERKSFLATDSSFRGFYHPSIKNFTRKSYDSESFEEKTFNKRNFPNSLSRNNDQIFKDNSLIYSKFNNSKNEEITINNRLIKLNDKTDDSFTKKFEINKNKISKSVDSKTYKIYNKNYNYQSILSRKNINNKPVIKSKLIKKNWETKSLFLDSFSKKFKKVKFEKGFRYKNIFKPPLPIFNIKKEKNKNIRTEVNPIKSYFLSKNEIKNSFESFSNSQRTNESKNTRREYCNCLNNILKNPNSNQIKRFLCLYLNKYEKKAENEIQYIFNHSKSKVLIGKIGEIKKRINKDCTIEKIKNIYLRNNSFDKISKEYNKLNKQYNELNNFERKVIKLISNF